MGNRTSGAIRCLLMGLIVWITVTKCNVPALHFYMDDNFGYSYNSNLVHYAPYDQWHPPDQVHLLHIWDQLGVPHSKHKQEAGKVLVIIGLLVDLHDLSISMPQEKATHLTQLLHQFILLRKAPLHQWQSLLGHANWALNVFPLLKPALGSSYAKLVGKSLGNASIFLNKQVKDHLSWFADMVDSPANRLLLDPR